MCGIFVLLVVLAFVYICSYSCLYILKITASSKNRCGTVHTRVAKLWWVTVPSNVIINFLFVDNFFAIFSFNGLSVIHTDDCVQLNGSICKYPILFFCEYYKRFFFCRHIVWPFA